VVNARLLLLVGCGGLVCLFVVSAAVFAVLFARRGNRT
jgi:hypothetical protein